MALHLDKDFKKEKKPHTFLPSEWCSNLNTQLNIKQYLLFFVDAKRGL
jgi:hypothetical protein